MVEPSTKRPGRPTSLEAYGVAAIIFLSFGLTGYLLAQGGEGSDKADVLSLPVGILGLIVAVLGLRRQQRHPPSAGEAVNAPLRIVGAVGAVAVGVVAALALWLWQTRYADLQVRFGTAQQLAEGASVTVPVTVERTPWRGTLTVTPRLAATSQLGNCVLPAVLRVTPIVDGQTADGVDGRHDEELSMPIPSGAHDVSLRVRLQVPGGQHCVVAISFADGVLHR